MPKPDFGSMTYREVQAMYARRFGRTPAGKTRIQLEKEILDNFRGGHRKLPKRNTDPKIMFTSRLSPELIILIKEVSTSYSVSKTELVERALNYVLSLEESKLKKILS